MTAVQEFYNTIKEPNYLLTQFVYDESELDYEDNSYINTVRNYAIRELKGVKKLLVDGINAFFRAPGSFSDYFETAFKALVYGFMALVLAAVSLIALALSTAAFTLSLFADWQMAKDLMVAMSSQATMAVMAIAVAVLGAIKPVVSIFTSARNIPMLKMSNLSSTSPSSRVEMYLDPATELGAGAREGKGKDFDGDNYRKSSKTNDITMIQSDLTFGNGLFSGELGRAVTKAWADVADAIKPAAMR